MCGYDLCCKFYILKPCPKKQDFKKGGGTYGRVEPQPIKLDFILIESQFWTSKGAEEEGLQGLRIRDGPGISAEMAMRLWRTKRLGRPFALSILS